MRKSSEQRSDYRAARDENKVPRLAALPDDIRIRSFELCRSRLLALPEAITSASPARREELCRLLVERVTVRDREVEAIDWVPAARPFFERQRVCPQGDSNP